MMFFLIIQLQAFLVGLVLPWLAESRESNDSSRTRIQTLEASPATLSISQLGSATGCVTAYRILRAVGHRVERVQPIFNQAADCSPETYHGYTFSQWL
jgi:hypothetical protein